MFLPSLCPTCSISKPLNLCKSSGQTLRRNNLSLDTKRSRPEDRVVLQSWSGHFNVFNRWFSVVFLHPLCIDVIPSNHNNCVKTILRCLENIHIYKLFLHKVVQEEIFLLIFLLGRKDSL